MSHPAQTVRLAIISPASILICPPSRRIARVEKWRAREDEGGALLCYCYFDRFVKTDSAEYRTSGRLSLEIGHCLGLKVDKCSDKDQA